MAAILSKGRWVNNASLFGEITVCFKRQLDTLIYIHFWQMSQWLTDSDLCKMDAILLPAISNTFMQTFRKLEYVPFGSS